MTQKQRSVPKYQVHSARNLGYVRYRDESGSRKQRYLPGPANSPESFRAYAEFLQAWKEGRPEDFAPRSSEVHRDLSDAFTVGELVAAYLVHADRYYVKAGVPTSEAKAMRLASHDLLELFGDTSAGEFSAAKLRAVRDRLEMSDRHCRRECNRFVSRIRRIFRWGVTEDLVPAGVVHSLECLEPLQPGRSRAREVAPKEAVPDDVFEATLPFMTPTLAAMCRFARYTGARPGEVCLLRWADVEKGIIDPESGQESWVFTVPDHKNFHRGHERLIGVGIRGQAALAGFECIPADDYVFSPARSQAERRLIRREKRKSRLTPSQRRRDQERADAPRTRFHDRWTAAAFGRAVSYACKKAGVPRWSPNALRHALENEAERRAGIEVASKALGHTTLTTTENYRSKRKRREAIEVARLIG